MRLRLCGFCIRHRNGENEINLAGDLPAHGMTLCIKGEHAVLVDYQDYH